VAHPLFLVGWRGKQQGEEGGKGEEGDTRCSCREKVTSRGREKGERRWSGGGVWTRVEGDPVRDFGDRRVGGGGAVGDKVRVGVGLEEGSRAGTGDEARPKVGVQEAAAHKVGAFESGGRARGSGVGDRREKSGVFEGKERIGKVREGFADARETGGGEIRRR
jgi:hypothetical protein